MNRAIPHQGIDSEKVQELIYLLSWIPSSTSKVSFGRILTEYDNLFTVPPLGPEMGITDERIGGEDAILVEIVVAGE
jgi:hypothetical protein